MIVTYGSVSDIPSREANSVNVMKMCSAFSNVVDEVNLITKNLVDKENVNLFEYYNLDNRFNISFVPWPNIFKMRAIRYSLRVVKKAKELKTDILYSRDVTCCLLGALAGLDVIWESHSPIEGLGKISVFQLKCLIKLSHLKKIIVISKNLKTYYKNQFMVPEQLLFVAPDGADLLKDEVIIKKEVRKDNSYNVGYTGHLYAGKGMEIIEQLVKSCPSIYFHIFGGKDSDIAQWKQRLVKHSNITFYGFIQQAEIASYALAMDALIAPYMKSVYGAGASGKKGNIGNWMSPLKLFEYMSYGKPIVCSDLPVLHDVMENKKNCIMCDPDRIEDWISAFNEIRNDNNLASSLSNNALSDLKANYTWNIRARRIIESVL